MIVEIDGREIKVSGELTLTPAFYADIASMNAWEPPHHDKPLTAKDIEYIISKVEKEHNAKVGVVKIYFD